MRRSSTSVGNFLPLTTMGASLRLAERLSRYSVTTARSCALTERCKIGFATGVGVGSALTEATGAGRATAGPAGRAGGRPAGFAATLGGGAAATCFAAGLATFFATGALAGLLAFLGAAVLAGFAAFLTGDFAFPALFTPRPGNDPASTSSSQTCL